MNPTELVRAQRAYFQTGATRDAAFRLAALKKLQAGLQAHERALAEAMMQDFRKSPMEVCMTETGMVLDELRYHIRHLRRWLHNQPVKTPLAQFPSRSFRSPEPYGVCLILAPWNYPIQLCLEPLIGAISGGNCAIIKPSAYAPATSRALAALLGELFDPAYIAVVEGGREENRALLEERFDFIFFTGSPTVGRVVMQSASRHLTAICLELGGKSPAIVTPSADLALAARRILFGKVLNAGQTCVEPDYCFVHRSVEADFLAVCRRVLCEFFPDGAYSEMPVIVNEKHYRRLKGLMAGEHAAIGGETDDAARFIAPTVLTGVTPVSPIMQEEIFGPILPLLPYDELDECIRFIRSREKPLALYLFTRERAEERAILNRCSFGGGCINDTIVHLATPHMPFGGVGASGMGAYHGRASFETFTHWRSILKKANWLDLPMRYHPYSDGKLALIRKFMK